MSIHISLATAEAAYELLRTTKPFSGWKLPHENELGFEITHSPDVFGQVLCSKSGMILQISAKRHHTLPELLKTLAHEMAHLQEYRLTGDCKHGATWHRLANSVCRHHNFDRGAF